MIQPTTILNIVGIVTVTLVIAAGIGVLSGYLLPDSLSEHLRTVVGIMMVGYGIFRGAMIYLRSKQGHREQEETDEQE